MEYKYKPGQRVRILDVGSLGVRKGWAGKELTLKRHDSDGWDEPGWSVEEPGCHYRFRESEMAPLGPIRTETVQRIEPGVYGPLEVRKEGKEPMECGGKKEPVVYAYLIPTYLNAAGWRDLARTATELAEFLDAQ